MKFSFLTVFEIFFKLRFSKFIQDIRTLESFGKSILIVWVNVFCVKLVSVTVFGFAPNGFLP